MINTNYNTYSALNSYTSNAGNTVNKATNNTLAFATNDKRSKGSSSNDVAVILTIQSRASGKAPILKNGSRGAEVTELQKNLTKLGYDTKGTDGIFGKNTEDAVRKFQKAHDLSVDGIVGEKTSQAIEKALKGTKTVKVLKNGSRGTEVTTLQKNLTKLGYDTKGADGIFGKNTEDAVRKFQKAYGLSVDGIVGEKTSQAIEKALKGEKPIEVLKNGSRGTSVKNLQKNLIKLGYNIKADGVYGNNTEDAVKRFQKAHGLSEDGIVGEKTSQAITKALKAQNTSIILKRGSRGAAVKELQNKLIQIGYNIKADGVYGKNTENAVKKFQKTCGMMSTGAVGAELKKIIDNAAKKMKETLAPVKAKQAMIDNIKNDKSLGLSEEKRNTLAEAAKRLLNDGYEIAFVAGVLGNIMNEGNCGQFEISNYESIPEEKPDYLKIVDEHFDYRDKFSGKYICDIGIPKTNKLLNDIKNAKGDIKKGKFGLGMAQWTGDRTEQLVKYYRKYSTKDTPTKQECIKAEVNFLADELKGEQYSFIYKNWKKGKKTAENAAEIFCRKYEKPRDTDGESKKRAENAKKIYNIMMKKAGV